MRRRKSLSKQPQQATVHDLTHEGHGVARVNDKTVFIPGTLPGEEIQFVYTDRKRNYDTGQLLTILRPSADRITPQCRHFDRCGGCNLQHLTTDQQLTFKQKIVLDNLRRIGHVVPATLLPPITGPSWGYRRRARLGVKYVSKKQRMLLGFRERASHLLADLSQCETLDPRVGHALTTMAQVLKGLSCYTLIPQVEVAVADNATAWVIRHLQPFTAADIEVLKHAAQQHGWQVYQQPAGVESITPIWPPDATLFYRVDADAIEIQFAPADFIQVNREVNVALIDAAIDALQLTTDTTVLELFSGLGNFSLPIARRAKNVVAVEGDAGLVKRAQQNTLHNQVANITHYVADLSKTTPLLPWMRSQYDRILLDPPRTGAADILPTLATSHATRIVYISCNPATLARDAGILVNQLNYRLDQIRVVDMFPHTAHVETLAVFIHT
ncbi:MAG: 23S rRNA (uracil(1939)-C(5))-methyltransferase RlmD [Gammaproteobacteria bacterium]|nr:23S rRNA (uracil(1939)-C(5))-methyltransferase RlmD [Gammaproteobacteria bacterium]